MNRLLAASAAIGLALSPACKRSEQANCPPAFTEVEDPLAIIDSYCVQGKPVPCHERTNQKGVEALRILTAEGLHAILTVDPYHEHNGGNFVCLDGKTYNIMKGTNGGLLLVPTRTSNRTTIAADGNPQTPVEKLERK